LDTTIKTVRDHIVRCLEGQLQSDVPLGGLLSGGLDSSTLDAFAVKTFNKGPSFKTYSIEYINSEQYFKGTALRPNPDGPWVRRMHEYLGCDHSYIQITEKQLSEMVTDAVDAFDYPHAFFDVIGSLMYLFQQVKLSGVPVVLSGECSDEVFGGYPWFHLESLLGNLGEPNGLLQISPKRRKALLRKDLADRMKMEEAVQEITTSLLSWMERNPNDSPKDARMREVHHLNIYSIMTILFGKKGSIQHVLWCGGSSAFCRSQIGAICVEYSLGYEEG